MQEVPKVPLPHHGSSSGASPLPARGASHQLKEEDGARQKYSALTTLLALPVAKDAGEGRRHPAKGFLPTACRKGIERGEQDLLGGAGHRESGLGLQRRPGETPSMFLFL